MLEDDAGSDAVDSVVSHMPRSMPRADREIIERFASGEWRLREQAFHAYESYKDTSCPLSGKHLGFMREIIHPTDLGQRMILRSRLLDGISVSC